nr:hypothetical protein [uncultured Lachnoclostridium sp.]
MKKIFKGIGLLVSLFSIFFFLLVVDKMLYENNSPIYDISLDKYISSQELKNIAESADITIQLKEYKKSSFGNRNMDITLINPDGNMKLGKKPSVFPNEKIVYLVLSQEDQRKIKYFTVQERQYKKINQLNLYLKENGYETSFDIDEPVSLEVGMLFSSLNLGFFSVLAILLILCISTYYVSRLKEIGILKLCGWSNEKISSKLLVGMMLQLYSWSLILVIPFGIYVILSDVNKIDEFIKIVIMVDLFLAAIFILCSIVGTFFITHIDRVNAIKSKKNNRILFGSLLVFKVVVTILLVVSMNNTFENIFNYNATNESVNKLLKYNFYRIKTASIPEKNVWDKIEKVIGQLSDDALYNYTSPDSIINIDKLKSYKKDNRLRNLDNCAYTDMSFNMLNYIKIYDEQGHIIKSKDISANSNVYLVPEHLKSSISDVMSYYETQEDKKIIYIKDGQVVDDILIPGYYVYDSVFRLGQTKKVLYLNNGEVLYTEKGIKILERELEKLGLDKGSFSIEPMSMDYNIFKANVQLDICESLFKLIINFASYILCIISICIIYLELRKKELAVHKLIGKVPIKTISRFIVLNCLITIIATVYVNAIFLILVIMEVFIYQNMIYSYIKHKVILALKGE